MSVDEMSLLVLQLGVALGFVVPVSVVRNQSEDAKIGLIGTDLFNMFMVVAIITTAIFILVVIREL
jgi:hypothetical protein